jgi:DNA repair protein RadC
MLDNQPLSPRTSGQNQNGAFAGSGASQLPSDLRTDFLIRLLASGANKLSDSELLELILANTAPKADKHSLAVRLLERFGSLGKVLHSDPNLLREIEGIDEAALKTLTVFSQVTQRLAKSQINDKPVIQSWSALMNYIRVVAGYAGVEQFRVLFLNHRHMVIADEVMQEGTINHTPVYPREIVKRALELSAAAIILIHNHPSGDPTPSRADIDITKKIVHAAATIGVVVHDHVIIAESGHYSFKSFGVLPDAEPAAVASAAASATPAEPEPVQLSLYFRVIPRSIPNTHF